MTVRHRTLKGHPLARLLGLGLLVVTAGSGQPAQASLLQPLLLLMRPQLENRLADLCVRLGAGGETRLEQSLRQPCRQLAGPVSTCLIRESEATGRTLGVITEMVGGRFGDDSEVVAKRCAAKLLGLPPESLKDVSLEDLGRRFSSQGSP